MMAVILEQSLFCTDEDLAARFRSDFEILCVREFMALGTDGVFAASSPWLLASPSNDWLSQGVAPGNVISIRGPTPPFGSGGALFGIDSVSSAGVVLRRLNMGLGVGLPPGHGGVTGVSFSAPTMAGPIELATYELERRFGISSRISGRTVGSMFDVRELRDACVLTVAMRRFLDLARQAQTGADLYFAKYGAAKRELDDLLARVTVHWQSSPNPSAQTTRVGRLER